MTDLLQGMHWSSWWDTSWLRRGHEEWRSRAVRMSPTLVSIFIQSDNSTGQGAEPECFNTEPLKINTCIYLISLLNSFCFYNNNDLAFFYLPQEVYPPWCTNIQSPPSLCHVLFASQKKVRSSTLPMHARVIELNVPLKRQLQAEQSRQCCE